MTRLFNINQWLYQIEHFYQSGIIEQPHHSLRFQFDISCAVSPHYVMFYCVGFEGRRAVFVCRLHGGLKDAHSVAICVYQDGWDADILERLDTEGGHSDLFRWWKITYVQATGSAVGLFWCCRNATDECVVDGAAEVGGVVGLVQFCSTINASQAIMPAIPVAPVAAPAFAASSCEIGGRLMIGPPAGGVYIGVGAAGGSGMSIGGN